jgi:putative alpha-1,2-mannosidase
MTCDSFGPGSFKYQAFACYDLNNNATQKLDQYGVWTGDPYAYPLSFFQRVNQSSHRNGIVARGLGETRLNLSVNLIGGVIESGALFAFAGNPTQVIIRVGVSFVSEEQACTNAESEIGTATFGQIQAQSKALWNERLDLIEIDVPRTPPNVTELLYSSLYRASLTPVSFFLNPWSRVLISDLSHIKNNATGEAQGDFAGTSSFYFDSLYCRSVFLFYWFANLPLMP